MKPTRTRLGATAVLSVCALMLGAIFLYLIGIDALEGRNTFQFFADSRTYHEAARGDILGIDGLGDSIAIASNFLGPIVFLKVTGDNYYAVMLVNVVLFYLSVASIATSLKLDSLRFAVLLLINPLTISSLLSVNKEIFSFVFLAFFVRALTGGSLLAWTGAALVSLLARWQLTLFLMSAALLVSPANPFRRHRLLTLVLMLAALSLAYLQLSSVFEAVRSALDTSAAEHEGSGLYEWLQGLQDQGAYILVFPLKAMHMLFSLGLRFDRLLAPTDVYNDVWQLLHSTATLVLGIALLRRRLFGLRNDVVYLSIVYMAVFALSPIYSPRYFYVLYALWAAALAAKAPIVTLLPAAAPIRRAKRARRRISQPVQRPHMIQEAP